MKKIKIFAVMFAGLALFMMTGCFDKLEDVNLKPVEEIKQGFPSYNIEVLAKINENGTEENLSYNEIKTAEGWAITCGDYGYVYDNATNQYFMVDISLQKKFVVTKDEAENYFDQYTVFGNNFIGFSSGQTLKMANKGNATVCGRQCTVYQSKANIIIAKAGYEIYIDNQYGIILKQTFDVSSKDAGQVNISWEITNLQTNGDRALYMNFVTEVQ